MTDNTLPTGLRFPAYELTRNVALGTILVIVIGLQYTILSESLPADAVAELARPMALIYYLVLLLMFLPCIRWGVNMLAYYGGRWWTGGEPT